MNREITELQHEAIEKCFNSKSVEHMDIMKVMIEKAYNMGRKQGQREMSNATKNILSDLIPNELYY